MKRLIFSTKDRVLYTEAADGQLSALVSPCTAGEALRHAKNYGVQVFADTGDGRDLILLSHAEGTPQNFQQALGQMLSVKGGEGFQERIQAVWKDYLAQKFSVAMLTAPSDDEAARLQDLFTKIVC